jgi:hypothetical protein
MPAMHAQNHEQRSAADYEAEIAELKEELAAKDRRIEELIRRPPRSGTHALTDYERTLKQIGVRLD